MFLVGVHAPLGGALTVDSNWWPGPVRWVDAESGAFEEQRAAGPFYRYDDRGASEMEAYPPFTVRYTYHDDALDLGSFHILHPLYSHYESTDGNSWNIFRIFRSNQSLHQPEDGWYHNFEIFPLYFDHRSYFPDESYFGIFPIYGDLRNRLFMERLSWILFPFYLEYERYGEVTYGYPWPFIRTRTGAGSSGWAFWPFYGEYRSAGRYDRTFALWPFGYDYRDWDDEGRMSQRFGVLPFYARETAPGSISEHYPWPFIGYTRTESPRYHEERFLWPFFVQGEGEAMFRNRWAPFYSHSYVNEREHWWWMWPFFNRKEWYQDGFKFETDRFLWVLLWHHEISDPRYPERPRTEKTHLWPFYSYWTNGVDRSQFQFPSFVEVWTQPNEKPRDLYNSFLSLYQYEREGGGTRHSVLWDLVTVDRQEARDQVTVGPLFDWKAGADAHRTRLLKGLLGYQYENGDRSYQLFWWTFGKDSSGENEPR